MTNRSVHDVAPALDPIQDLANAEVTHPVSPDTARVLLNLEPVGRVVIPDPSGRPIVLPVNHRLERDGSLLMRTARGTKLAAARRGGIEVAFEVDRLDEHGRGWVVVATGKLEEILDLTEVAHYDRTPGPDVYADRSRRDRWLRLQPRTLRGFRLGQIDVDAEPPADRRETVPRPAPPTAHETPTTADPALTDRGGLEILDLGSCYALLAATPVGRVAYVSAGEPMVLPVNHHVDGRRVYFRSAVGSKTGAADRSRPVAFEVDGYDEATRTGWSVLVRGTLDVVWDDAEIEHVSTALPQPWADAVERDRLLVIHPTSVTGRRIQRSGEAGS